MGMIRTFKAVIAALVLAVSFAGSVAAGPYDDALDAYFNKEDYATTLRLIRPLAEQGHADAQYFLGTMYHDGVGVPRDYATAASWYRKAAERWYVMAQGSLGGLYVQGHGVPQDDVLAHMWFILAAVGDKTARVSRDFHAKHMTPAQIAEAQKLAREWKPR
jgi:uncharacterized protein